ncbi:MAG TPA: hypothetical protein VFJ58_03110 [Armatimonadota bacterium]|nr:hypothetical protein [Armatimonadota bacterium]
MTHTVQKSRIARMAAHAALVGACLSMASAAQAQRLTAPLAPEGTARTIGLSDAVVALGGDLGSITVNPANIAAVGPIGGSDATIAGGALGPDFFIGHAFGQTPNSPPGAIWAGALNSAFASEQFIALTAGASGLGGVATGATFRYERWTRNGIERYRVNADVGVHQDLKRGFSVGLSGLNLFHVDPFSGTSSTLPTDTEIIGGLGYVGHSGRLEGDYVYTKDHSYFRLGGELKVYKDFVARSGFSDRDFSVGAGFTSGTNTVSIALDYQRHQHALIAGGYSAHF